MEGKCAVHPDRDSSAKCHHCGRSYCADCVSGFFHPPACDACSVGSGIGARKGVPRWVWLGLALGILVTCGVPCLIVIAIAVPTYLETRKTANEFLAISQLKALAIAQEKFRVDDWDVDGTFDYADSIQELVEVDLIDSEFAQGARGGYRFSLSGGTYVWQASATPLSSRTGGRNFIICIDGVVHYANEGMTADCDSAAAD